MHGDSRIWLTHDMGIKFDQQLPGGRNCHGLCGHPHHLPIAEDAVFSVPKHPDPGSLLCWGRPVNRTLSRVVILTASPGIFSAVMMGVWPRRGETMIVLMATGNTPHHGLFHVPGPADPGGGEHPVEMPESEVGSSHHRVLFLAAFVLFVFTFLFQYPGRIRPPAVCVKVQLSVRTKESTMGKWFKSGAPGSG